MEKQTIGFIGFSIIIIVGLVFVTEAVKNVYSTAEDIDDISLSGTEGFVYTSPETIDTTGQGITSLSSTSPNQTWLDFDGVNDYVKIGNTIKHTNNYTITLYIKPILTPSSQIYISISDNTKTTDYFYIGKSGSSFRWENRNSSVTKSLNFGNIANNDWKFITVVKNDTLLTTYIDGVINNTHDINYSLGEYTITNNTYGALVRTTNSAFINGSLDEIRIYNRTLSEYETSLIYNVTSKAEVNLTYFTLMGSSQISQRSYPYSGQYKDGITYIVYPSRLQNPYLIYYNHNTKEWSNEIKIGENNLTNDQHGNPVMFIDSQNYIHIFYGSHGGIQQYKRANLDNLDNLEDWIDLNNIDDNSTYPTPFEYSNGNIIIFYRNGEIYDNWVYKLSIDNGNTWGDKTILSDDNSVDYFYHNFVMGTNNVIHDTFTRVNNTGSRFDLYYIFKNNSGWYNASGYSISLPFNRTIADLSLKILSSGINRTVEPSINYDSNNKPYIIYGHGNGTYYPLKLISYNNGWNINETGIIVDSIADYPEIIVHNINEIELYIPTTGIHKLTRGGDYSLYKTINGGNTWVLNQTFLTETNSKEVYDSARRIKDFNSELKIIVGMYETDYSKNYKLNYAYGDNGFVQRKYSYDDLYTEDLLINSRFNEANGTIAYDSSGNSNNGTISGATWQTDGSSKTLVENVDYSHTSNTFTLLNNDYLYSWIDTSYNYDSQTSDGNRNATVLRLAGIVIISGLLMFCYWFIKEQMGWID